MIQPGAWSPLLPGDNCRLVRGQRMVKMKNRNMKTDRCSRMKVVEARGKGEAGGWGIPN